MWIKRIRQWFELLAQTLWQALSGIINAIAGLFGYRPPLPLPAHENIKPEDVEDALTQARADLAATNAPDQDRNLDAALDLIWHYVNAPAAERPWIDLAPLSEQQRAWLLSLPDGEIARLADAGQMATVEAALLGKPFPSSRARRNRKPDNNPIDLGTSPPSKADAVREQFVLRVVRKIAGDDPSRRTIVQTDNPVDTPDVLLPLRH